MPVFSNSGTSKNHIKTIFMADLGQISIHFIKIICNLKEKIDEYDE